MLDTPRVITTPEGIDLTLNIAGVVTRARAWAIDALIRIVFYVIMASALAGFGRFGMGFFLVFLFLMEWAYPVLFEIYWHGATPGKRACNLCVLHDDGTPVSWRASVTRNTLRAVDFLPFMYGFGLISCLLNREFKRLGDLAAGTVVVYVESRRTNTVKRVTVKPNGLAMPNMNEPGSSTVAILPAHATFTSANSTLQAPLIDPLPATLTLDEQHAVINYAERRPRWSDARAAELANHASALLAGKRDQDAVARLIHLARKITGQPASQVTSMKKDTR